MAEASSQELQNASDLAQEQNSRGGSTDPKMEGYKKIIDVYDRILMPNQLSLLDKAMLLVPSLLPILSFVATPFANKKKRFENAVHDIIQIDKNPKALPSVFGLNDRIKAWILGLWPISVFIGMYYWLKMILGKILPEEMQARGIYNNAKREIQKKRLQGFSSSIADDYYQYQVDQQLEGSEPSAPTLSEAKRQEEEAMLQDLTQQQQMQGFEAMPEMEYRKGLEVPKISNR